MTHGIDAYFAERAHFARRVARTLVGVSVLLLGLQWGLVLVGRNPGAAESLRNLSMSHWGYEGAEQYVRRIELETRPGASSTNPGARAEFIPATRRGASHDRDRSVDPHARPVVVSAREGKGDAEADRQARARARLMNVPLVRSENLVIDHLVRPLYPEEARDQGIEGRVTVLALVDTNGAVKHVESVGARQSATLQRAAETAVWKCRFRPYLVDSTRQEVYAMFRFSFRIY